MERHLPPRRKRVALAAMAVAALLVAVLCLIDLILTYSGAAPSSTRLLSVPPVVEVLVLGAVCAATAALWQVALRNSTRTELRAEAAEEDAERLLKVIDNTSAVIYMRSSEGRYLLVNRQYERLFGIRRQDIVGLTDHDLFPRAMADDFRANDLKALARGAPIQMEEIAPHADGPHTYITVKYPIADAAGRHYAICGISTDITDLKRAEEEVFKLNTDLEGRVRERTAELEISTRELDTFAYSVSHDLRAPLRAIDGFSEILLKDYHDRLDDIGQDYLRRVVSAAARMNQLIDDLLNLSRAARTELVRRPVDLTTIAYRVLADLELADPDLGGRTEVVVDEGLKATGDPAMLELVLQNLISNAWKFTAKQDRPHIHVGSERLPGGGSAYFVRDNGAGFDMRYADQLFVPFQRLHSAAEFAGSGIGLAIVGRIIARHGGRIWAEGSLGGGAVFRFVLPMADPADGAEREPARDRITEPDRR